MKTPLLFGLLLAACLSLADDTAYVRQRMLAGYIEPGVYDVGNIHFERMPSFTAEGVTLRMHKDDGIVGGVVTMPHNNWPWSSLPSFRLDTVREGEPLRWKAPVDLLLWSEDFAQSGESRIHYAAELVPAELLKSKGFRAGRDYHTNPKLTSVLGLVSRNVSISGLRMVSAGPVVYENGQWRHPKNFLTIGLAYGVALRRVSAEGHSTGAIITNLCRDVLLEDCEIGEASASGVGAGYGYVSERCTGVLVSGGSYTDIKSHGGTVRLTVRSALLLGPADWHGAFELYGLVSGCYGPGGVAFGNKSWLGGGYGHRVENSALRYLFVGANASASVHGSSFTDPVGNEALIAWDGATLSAYDSSFTSLDAVINHSGDLQADVRLYRCTIRATRPDWGPAIKLRSGGGRLLMDGCDVYTASAFEPIDLRGGSYGFELLRSRIHTAHTDGGVWIRSSFAGSFAIEGNTLYTGHLPTILSQAFLHNSSAAQGSASGNRVIHP
jgi:hypothetical protein